MPLFPKKKEGVLIFSFRHPLKIMPVHVRYTATGALMCGWAR